MSYRSADIALKRQKRLLSRFPGSSRAHNALINVNPVRGECGQRVGIWQILKFFDQISQGGKRKVNQKCQKCPHSRGKNLNKQYYRAFSLTRPASMLIYWNKRKHLHEKRIQLPEDFLGTPTWPLFLCFETPIWPPWRRHVKTLKNTV